MNIYKSFFAMLKRGSIKLILSLPLILLILNSCTQNSSLSDVNLDDPSLIKPDIFIDKSITSNSITYTNATWLLDKNDNSIELKSGGVSMNNITMSVKHSFNNAPYYTFENMDILPFQLKTTYESEISLSDGTVYKSAVTTREKDLYQLNVPAELSKNQDLNLSWADAANDMDLELTMVLTGHKDTTNYLDVYKFKITNPLSGKYTIPNSYYINRPELNQAQLTLEAINTGQINKSFMNGSKITSTLSITRNVNLK